MNTQAYETYVSSYKSRQKTTLLIAAGAMVLGFLLAATGIGAIVGIGAMIYLVIMGVRASALSSHAKKSMKALYKAGKYENAMEGFSQASTCQLNDQTYAWNEAFLYLPYGAIYPLEKVAWIYPYCQNISYLFIFRFSINACKLFLKDGTQSLMYYGKAKDQEAFKKLLIGLKEAQPALLLGYSAENQKLYDQIKAGNK